MLDNINVTETAEEPTAPPTSAPTAAPLPTIPADAPLKGFEESTLTVENDTASITGLINGYPVSALRPVLNADADAEIVNAEGADITDGYVYDDYKLIVTDGSGTYTYTFKAEDDIYSNNFNSEVSLSDKTTAITYSNRGQRDNLFPAEDAEYNMTTEKQPNSSAGAVVSSWDQSLFQNVAVGAAAADPLSLTREAAPYKTDRAIALKADAYTGTSNIQVIKDFYMDDENYPVSISMNVNPDGNGDVSIGLKTTYYNEAAAKVLIHDLIKNYMYTPEESETAVLKAGVYAYKLDLCVNEPVIWGDYYFMEALVRLLHYYRMYW